MRKNFRILFSILSAVMLSLPLTMSGQLLPKMGQQNTKVQTSEINRTARSRTESPDRFLNPREIADQGEQISYIRNSFIPSRNPFQAMSAAADGIEFIGWVYVSKTGEGMSTDAHHGLYSITLDDEFTPIDEYIGDYFDGGMAGLYIDGTYHYYYSSTVTWPVLQYKHRVYNTEAGWSYTEENITNEQTPRALCSNGEVSYGCFFTGEYDSYENPMFVFGKFDPATSDHTTIASLPEMWAACAYGADGYIYAIDKSGYLQKVDRETGDMTSIGWTGCNPKFTSDAVIDIKSGRMFWAIGLASGYGKMYEVNLSTGSATELVSFKYGDHIVGLNIMKQAWGAAPANVENLVANFTDDSMTGTITFTAPTQTYDGKALSGDLTYILNVDGEQHSTGTCTAGENVSLPLTFTQAATHVISVTVSNQDGTGPRETIKTFIGKDTPVAPQVKITYADGKFTVTWNAVTESVNGGYMDPSKITYKVTRLPDNVVVAEATTETSLIDEVGEPSTNVPYSYTVQASWDGIKSGIGTSNIIGIGSIFPPYREEFLTKESLDGFTIINANNDSQTWQWYYTYVRCKYGTGKMDDWLITPAIRLEAGKSYYISIDAKCHNSDYPERLEIKVGKEATAEGMTETVVGPTEVSQTYPYVTIGDYFECTETGNYYVGIHGISDSKMFYLNIDNLSVGAGIGDESPAPVEDFRAVTDPSGAFNAIISGKAPSTTEGGDNLGSLSKIDIFRNGTKITTIAPIKPGTEFSYTDNVGNKGEYTYSAIATNEKGSSREVSTTTNIGFAVPAKVSDLRMTETAPGVVEITWTAPTTDVEDTPLGDSKITYKIVNALSTSEVYVEDIEGTSYTYNLGDNSQKLFAVGVIATNFAGDSEIKYSDMIAVGKAYDAPYKESFADGKAWSILGTKGYNGSSAFWSTRTDSSIETVTASDGDNGYISGKFQYAEDKSMLFTGKIDLRTSEHPFISVDLYNHHNSEFANADNNYLEIVVAEANTNDWKVLKEGMFTDLAGDNYSKWVTVSADLAAYKGKTIQVGLRVSCYGYALALFDNLRVGDIAANDLAITILQAPAVVKANKEFEISATITNNGYQTAENYTVEFYRGTTLIESQNGVAIATNATSTFTLKQTLGLTGDDAKAEYRCRVVFADDANQADNEATVTVTRTTSEKPAPTDLSAEASDNGIHLTWTAPNTDGPVTDEFEDEESWAYENVGDWTFVDADQGPIGGFQGIELPNNNSESNRAFFVFDNSDTSVFNYTYAMHSGNKCLVSMFLLSAENCDDWAISPELDGSAQTISFWARSYSPQYPEHIEILYSTTEKETSDFINIDENKSVGTEWAEYTVNVPEGTKYFAIRSRAADALMLMIDDVTYVPANAAPVGYNIYRDGEKINESPVTATEFTDTMAEIGQHSYLVTAVYRNERESDPSNEATIEVAGIGSVKAAQTITAGRGFIRISGAEGLPTTVTAVNGYMLYNDTPENTIEVKLASGVYLVRIENKTTKVYVK